MVLFIMNRPRFETFEQNLPGRTFAFYLYRYHHMNYFLGKAFDDKTPACRKM